MTNTANMPLGPEHAQLNYTDDTLGQNMINRLTELDYFTVPQIAEQQDKLSAIEDSVVSLEQRARSYLHSNCAGCHRPGGFFADLDLRYSTPFSAMNLCNVEPRNQNMEGYIDEMQRLAPGEPNLSMLLFRMKTLEPNLRMPKLGTTKDHTLATEVIANWISSMTSCN